MKLVVATPLAVVVEADDVVHVRAEDATGAFGILSGHADFLTALAVSVASWRNAHGVERHVAVRGGMLEVRDGDTVTIATREAVAGDDLGRLRREVVASFRRSADRERAAHSDAQRLYLAAIRQICRFLGHDRARAFPGAPGGLHADGSEP